MNLNFSPSPSPSPFPFPMEQMKEKVVEHDDEQQYHQALNFGLNHHQINVPSSSSSASCHIFFNPAQDHAGFYHPQLYQPQHHHPEDDYYAYHDGGSSSSYEMEKKVENGLKLSLQWKKEDQVVKWMKKEDGGAKIEVKKVVKLGWSGSCCEELSGDDLSSNSNSSSYNYCNITPIRVCSDCHTTKTPLWRSGPKGPKSLCNACGIRQRKARRAVAAAAAAANGGGGVTCNPPRATKEKVKVKEKMGKIGLKKRCKVGGGGGGGGSSTSTSTSSGKKKKKKINGFEDFLINLSNKLAIHRVFPQDEKEAAILLMALSSGLFHG